MTKPKLPPGARQRPDGRYEQRITLDGKRISIYATTPRELKANVEAARDRHAQRMALRANETVATYLTRWLADVIEPHRERRTFLMHRNNVQNHIIPALGHVRLDRLAVVDVRTFLNGHIGTHKPGSINIIRATLVAALNEAINEEILSRNVAARVPKVKGVEPHRPPLSHDDAHRFLAAVADDRLAALYTVALACGLRINEALGLIWSNIDFTTGVVTIERQLQRMPGRFVRKRLKNAASLRTVVLPAFALTALAAHRERQEAEKAARTNWENEWGLVFTGPRGQPLYDSYVRVMLGRYCVGADLPHATPHDFRHTAASLLAAQGVPEIEVAALLGHATSATTRAIYTHAYTTGKDRVASVMDDLFLSE